VADALHEALSSLGVPHDVVHEVPRGSKDVYVIFTTHHLHEELPTRYISYNFEQLITEKHWPDAFFERLRGAVQVWDYSLENVNAMSARGVSGVLHIPLGYSPCMEHHACRPPVTAASWRARPWDWLMLGGIGPLRAAKLRALFDGYSDRMDCFLATNSCWGADLGAAYADSKVGLNIHYYPGKTILEVHRIIPMVANRVWVVSEHSDDPWYDEAYKGLVTFLPKGIEVARVSQALKGSVGLVTSSIAMPPERVACELERRRAHLVEHCSYAEYIGAKLSDILSVVSQFD
jgi:hypothetical protein